MKTYLIIENDEVLYRATIEDDVYTLHRSKSLIWNGDWRGEKLLALECNGNGVKLSQGKKKLDYSELEHLRILLNIYNGEQPNNNKQTIVEI
jgi:hypothetical protein